MDQNIIFINKFLLLVLKNKEWGDIATISWYVFEIPKRGLFLK